MSKKGFSKKSHIHYYKWQQFLQTSITIGYSSLPKFFLTKSLTRPTVKTRLNKTWNSHHFDAKQRETIKNTMYYMFSNPIHLIVR